MRRASFNESWQVRAKPAAFAELRGAPVPWEDVTLPHDALIRQGRIAPDGEATMESGAAAYFPGGVFEYRKAFEVPERLSGGRMVLEFEGVYRDATVFVNGDYAGQRPYGYSLFRVDMTPFLRFGVENEVRVVARAHKDSRWYSGAGIYRDTWLLTGGPVRVAADGLRVTASEIDSACAVVEVAVRVENDSPTPRTVEVAVELSDAGGRIHASGSAWTTVLPCEPAVCRQRLPVLEPGLWSPDTPRLYTAKAVLRDGAGTEVDEEAATFGIRSLGLDPARGLRINGKTVKLRGACVHHDNGLLGAATFARAEERRVELLKAAGFNAIRMSHHPMSRAMLEACDRLGVLVVDEAFDTWTSAKSDFDYSLCFPEWWERDLESMVAKDANHPSVILYSIGNEIPEAGSPFGAVWGRRLAEKVRELDGTRYVTNGINIMLAVIDELRARTQDDFGEGAQQDRGINTLMADDAGTAMDRIAASDLATRRTAESFGLLDVAGMNYSEVRYGTDKRLFPHRVILGTETFPTRIAGNWKLVQEHDHVIGDFTWTGWDYLGEVGIGRPQYFDPENPGWSLTAPYPYLLAGCGDIDITGLRRPASYHREIVFGLRDRPYLAVRRPEHHGKVFAGSPWAWSDAIAGWTWPGHEHKPITVEVYSAAEEVELLINGRSLGHVATGPEHRFRAEFETVYEPGVLVAIEYREGQESGRDELRTAGEVVRLHAEVDRPLITTRPGDLAFVSLLLQDADGNTHPMSDRLVRVEVSGDGTLEGFGSAAPETEERFGALERRTYEGRALAVLRPTGAGKIRLVASASGCEPAEIVVTVEDRA